MSAEAGIGDISSESSDAKNTAQTQVNVFKSLAQFDAKDPDDEEFARGLGFASVQELASAELGTPLRIYSVPIEKVQNFAAGEDVNKYILDTHRLVYPVLVDGKAKSSVTVIETGEGKGWRLIEMGSSNLIRSIQKQNASPGSFLVLITPLGLRFIGDRRDNQVVLTSLVGNSAFKLNPGDKVAAGDLLAKLAPVARDTYESERTAREMFLEKGRKKRRTQP